ncbi:hypothetical protein BSY18_4143 (plasmid) [Blastomonas sp. RAC04]|nr:hypothetical protein BSY18_4143 [Blastomonas sp. RAC04]
MAKREDHCPIGRVSSNPRPNGARSRQNGRADAEPSTDLYIVLRGKTGHRL